jgi:aminoglycoside N3'-acetyltransferase
MMSHSNHVTYDDILCGLKKAGIARGMTAEVHSSLSSFGHVEGGADTVIRALINAVGPEGGIVMPAFRISPPVPMDAVDMAQGITLKLKILSEDFGEKSGMGLIADTFSRRADVMTGKGLFRVSAWGKDRELNSLGFQNIIDSGGMGVMLGVDIYSLSSMHYMEGGLPEEIRAIFKPPEEVRRRYPEDQWFVETGVPPVKAWYKIQEEAYRLGYIRDTYIGPCKCMSFVVKDVTGLYKTALKNDPLGLYGMR